MRERANLAYDEMQDAWRERCDAREEMNREYEALQIASNHYREVWDEYGRIRDANNARIESLRYEADNEHRMMRECFDRASDAYEYGDKSEAGVLIGMVRPQKGIQTEKIQSTLLIFCMMELKVM